MTEPRLNGTEPRYKTLCATNRTPRRIAANNIRSLRKIRETLIGIAGDWGDVYSPVVLMTDEVLVKLDELEATLADGIDFLEEPLP